MTVSPMFGRSVVPSGISEPQSRFAVNAVSLIDPVPLRSRSTGSSGCGALGADGSPPM